MERRRSERKAVKINIKISLDNKSYDGFIYNISQEGLYLNIIIVPTEILTNFVSGTKFELKFQTNTEKEITPQCEIKWVNISPESNVGIIYLIGAEIIDPPDEYKEFLMTL